MNYFCQRNTNILKKNANISKIEIALVVKGVFSVTVYVCVLMYEISSF